jgi:hypothetical protein
LQPHFSGKALQDFDPDLGVDLSGVLAERYQLRKRAAKSERLYCALVLNLLLPRKSKRFRAASVRYPTTLGWRLGLLENQTSGDSHV